MVQVLFCGDPHFQVNNIPDVEMFIDRIEKLALKQQPDIIVIGGDTLHTHEKLHTIPLNKAYEFVKRMRDIAPTFILVGNHDMCNQCQFLTENHWLNGMKEWRNVIIVDKVVEFSIDNEYFVFVPFVPNGRFIEALNTIGDKWKNASAIFAHQEFAGCSMGGIISVDGDKWDLTYPQVISGHIHIRQIPQANIYYPGSAMQHAYGDGEHHIIALCKFNKGFIYEEVDLKLPCKKTVYMDVQDVETFELPKTKDKLRVTVKGGYEEFKTFKKTNKYKDLVKHGVKVVFRPRKIKEEKEVKCGEFRDVLHRLILETKDSYLLEVYEFVVNNKEIKADDVIFV